MAYGKKKGKGYSGSCSMLKTKGKYDGDQGSKDWGANKNPRGLKLAKTTSKSGYGGHQTY